MSSVMSDRGLSGSKTGEVVSSEVGFRRLLAFPVVFLHILGLAHDGLLPEADLVEVGLVDVKTDLARGVLDCLLSVTLLGLEVLLGGQHCQLLLLDPLGVHLALLGRAAAIGSVSEIHSLGAVVLLEGELLGLLGLLGFLIEQLLDAQLGRNDFFSLGVLVLEVLLGVLQILGVAHVSVSASSFAGSVPEWREKYSLPVPDLLSWKWPSPSSRFHSILGLSIWAYLWDSLVFSGSDSLRGAFVISAAFFSWSSCCFLKRRLS